MTERGQPKSRSAGRRRGKLPSAEKRRIERLVARHGLRRGPRPAGLGPGRGWVGLLSELGPVAAAFGHHLCLRADVRWIDGEQRAALARLDAASPAVDLPPLPATVAEIDGVPELADWSGAWFRARGAGGRAMRLFIGRPGLAAQAEETVAVLEQLAELTRAGDLDGGLDTELVLDFFEIQVRPRLDLERRVLELERLRAQGPDVLVVPELVPDLAPDATGGSMLAVEDSPRARGLLSGGPMRSRGPAAARLLAASFVDLLAEAGLLATDLQIARLDDGRAFLLDGCFAEPCAAGEAKHAERILELLRATAGERPRDVVEVWRPEIEACGLEAGALRSKLRQATPRRGGSHVAGESARSEATAEYAVAYWRAASEAGLELGRPWRAAAVGVETLRRRLAEWDPEGDALAGALVEQSWRESGRQLRALATPRRVGVMAESYASAFVRLPSLIDRALDAPPTARTSPPRRESSRLRASAPYVLGLVSISLVAARFGDQRLVELGAAALFVLLSTGLLRVVLR